MGIRNRLLFLLFLAVTGCSGPEKKQDHARKAGYARAPLASMNIYPEKIDFGRVRSGSVVKGTFYLTNLGAVPLTVISVSPECGCTVASFSREAILQNDSAAIHFEFDTKNRKGFQRKRIAVLANTPEMIHNLWFEGTVE